MQATFEISLTFWIYLKQDDSYTIVKILYFDKKLVVCLFNDAQVYANGLNILLYK